MKHWHKTVAFVELGNLECPQTHTREMCVADSDEGRAIKARKLLGRMSCNVTHGRSLKASRPEGGLNSKHLWENTSLLKE